MMKRFVPLGEVPARFTAVQIAALNWDWTQDNATLARRYNLSRERVRQIRASLDLTPSTKRGEKERAILETVERLTKQGVPINIHTIAANCHGDTPTFVHIRNVLRKHGIEQDNDSVTLFWENVNWDLPNRIVADLWGFTYKQVAHRRSRLMMGDPKWSCQGMHNAKQPIQDPKFKEAVAAEMMKIARLSAAGISRSGVNTPDEVQNRMDKLGLEPV